MVEPYGLAAKKVHWSQASGPSHIFQRPFETAVTPFIGV